MGERANVRGLAARRIQVDSVHAALPCPLEQGGLVDDTQDRGDSRDDFPVNRTVTLVRLGLGEFDLHEWWGYCYQVLVGHWVFGLGVLRRWIRHKQEASKVG